MEEREEKRREEAKKRKKRGKGRATICQPKIWEFRGVRECLVDVTSSSDGSSRNFRLASERICRTVKNHPRRGNIVASRQIRLGTVVRMYDCRNSDVQ